MALITADEGRTPPKAQMRGPLKLKRFARDVYVRELTFIAYLAVARNRWVESDEQPGKYVPNPVWPAHLVAACACDAEGKAIWSEADVEAIAAWPATDARTAYQAAVELNPDPEVEAEEEAKNSSEAPSS